MYKDFHFGNLGAFAVERLILVAGLMALASFVAGSFTKLDIEEFKVFNLQVAHFNILTNSKIFHIYINCIG